MDTLLDTHALIWWMLDSKRLGQQARKAILADGARTLISAVSVWEIAIKSSRGRLQLEQPPEEWIPNVLTKGFEPIPITFQHASAIRTLPNYHGDPFDRMLIAQAICENLTIVTADAVIRAYDVPIIDASI